MPEESGGEKTLPASPRKKQRAREDGNVVKSQDLSAAITLLVALGALLFVGPNTLRYLVLTGRHFFGEADLFAVSQDSAQELAVDTMWHLAPCLLPTMVLLLIAGVAVNVSQVGFLFAPKVLQPKPEKLNPVTGMKKFVSIRSGVELTKSILKLTIIAYVVYLTLRNRWAQILLLGYLTPMGIVKVIGALVVAIWIRVVAVLFVLGILDYAFQRWRHDQDLRMTVQEARQEMREMEGDPRIRQRVRQIQRQMAMQRMMAEVPTADVVVTNPTTYAVALRYEVGRMGAPVVVAKGARLLADRIRAIAIDHDVPIVEKPELARNMYRTIEVGQAVPEELFRAVAEVLAFVYEIDRRADKVRERAPLAANTA